MKSIKTILAVAFLTLIAISANAQNVTIIGGFQNLNVANQNLPGIGASVEYRIGSYGEGRWSLGVVADGAYHYDTNNVLDRFQFLGGAKGAYGRKLQVFARALYGVTRFDQQNPNLRDFARGTVSVGGGVDVNLGDHFVVRPFQFDLQWIDERPVRYTRALTGIGYRF
jgi:hypothetical protein